MPIKKKQSKSKQKEELPEANSMEDGSSNYYIGGWSHYRAIHDLTTIAHDVVAKHMGDDRRVKPLPRTTVLLVPPVRVVSSVHAIDANCCESDEQASLKAANEYTGHVAHSLPQQESTRDAFGTSQICTSGKTEKDVECVVTVCDKMSIEGVSRRSMNDATMHFRSLLPPESYRLANATASSAVHDTMIIYDNNTNNTTNEKNDEKASNDDANQANESLFALHPDAVDHFMGNGANDDQRNEAHEASPVNVSCGANLSAQDVCVAGYRKLIITGAAPCIVIDPVLPSPPAELKDEMNTTSDAARRPHSNSSTRTSTTNNNPSSKRPSSKRRSKVKQTQEELEEVERKRAEAAALFKRQTDEAIARAREEELLASTFAHPNQWAHVSFTNVTFTSPVVVQGAHVVFQHCRFVSCTSSHTPATALAQLTISQYCHVRCTHCTFELPVEWGVYAYPTSQLDLHKCLFTGIAHADLMRNAFTINASNTEVNTLRWNERINKIKSMNTSISHNLLSKISMERFNTADNVGKEAAAAAASVITEEHNSMRNKYSNSHEYGGCGGDNDVNEAHKTTERNVISEEIHINNTMNEQKSNNELCLSPVLATLYHHAQQTRPSAIGVHADQARVSVTECQFLFLQFGCVFNGCHPSHAHVHSSQTVLLQPTSKAIGKKTQVNAAKHLSSESVIRVVHSHFYHLYGSGVVLQRSTRHVKAEHNTFASCAYYAIDVQCDVHDNVVTDNTFSHNALMRIRSGGKARVLHNAMESLLIDNNKYENLCL